MERPDVIIPVYKADKKLERLLAMLLQQTLRPAKIILMNTETEGFTVADLRERVEKVATKNAYIGSFAEQLINGVRRIVIFLSRSEGRVRLAITPGTVHPNPISIGTMLRPESPIFLRSLSIIKATRAIYPVSSSKDRKKNNTIMIGRKLSTLPTPLKIPSMISP